MARSCAAHAGATRFCPPTAGAGCRIRSPHGTSTRSASARPTCSAGSAPTGLTSCCCRRSSARPRLPALSFQRRATRRGGRAEGLQRRRGAGRVPFTVTHRALRAAGDDAQARYIEVVADGVTIADLPAERQLRAKTVSPKTRLDDALAEHAGRADPTRPGDHGDFNVAPPCDYPPARCPPDA